MQAWHDFQVLSDSLRNAALLIFQPRRGALRVNKGDDRHMEALSLAHHAQRLAAAFGMRQAEATFGLFFEVAALLVAQDEDRLAINAGHTALNGAVVAIAPVAAHLKIVVADELDIVVGVGAVTVAGDLYALPAGEIAIDLACSLFELLFQTSQLRAFISFQAVALALKPLDAFVEFGKWALEFEIICHWPAPLLYFSS